MWKKQENTTRRDETVGDRAIKERKKELEEKGREED